MRENEFDRVFRGPTDRSFFGCPGSYVAKKYREKKKDDRKGFLLRWGYISSLRRYWLSAEYAYPPSGYRLSLPPAKKSVPNTHRAASVPGPVSARLPFFRCPQIRSRPQIPCRSPTKRSIQPPFSQNRPLHLTSSDPTSTAATSICLCR